MYNEIDFHFPAFLFGQTDDAPWQQLSNTDKSSSPIFYNGTIDPEHIIGMSVNLLKRSSWEFGILNNSIVDSVSWDQKIDQLSSDIVIQ